MLRRFVFLSAFVLSIFGSILHAQDAPPPLAEDPTYQAGLRALQDELPDLAARRFEEVLEGRKEGEAATVEVQLHLIEALVRSGQLEKVEPLLSLPGLAENERVLYWRARYRYALGHYYDAAVLFEQLDEAENPGLRRLARLSRARIMAALGEPGEALPILEKLTANPDAATATEAKLLQASLQLNAGELEAATALLAELDPQAPSLAKQKQYLEGRLALGKKDWETAFGIFRALTTPFLPPSGPARRLFQGPPSKSKLLAAPLKAPASERQ